MRCFYQLEYPIMGQPRSDPMRAERCRRADDTDYYLRHPGRLYLAEITCRGPLLIEERAASVVNSQVELCLGGGECAQVGGQFLRGEGFDQVAFLEVAEAAEADAALHAVGDFAGIVLEAFERSDLALE